MFSFIKETILACVLGACLSRAETAQHIGDDHLRQSDLSSAIQRMKSECKGLFRDNQLTEPYVPPSTSATKFLLLTRARSGSTFLSQLLDHHPQIRCFGEALHPSFMMVQLPGWPTLAARDANRRNYLETLYSGKTLGTDVGAIGFKAFPQHLSLSEFVGLTLSQDVKKIVLRRNNLLDVYLSECKAKTVNSYHFVNTSEVKVALSPNGFFKYAHDSEQHYRCIAAAKSASRFNDQQGSNWQYVSYESHLTSPTAIHATLMRLFKHLNVALYQNASRSNASNAYADYVLEETFAFVKQDTSSQESSITNFADVVAALRNSRYESMIRHGA